MYSLSQLELVWYMYSTYTYQSHTSQNKLDYNFISMLQLVNILLCASLILNEKESAFLLIKFNTDLDHIC